MAGSTPRFTRRDFQWIADTIAEACDWEGGLWHDAKGEVVQTFADRLVETNPNFSVGLFIKACGVDIGDDGGISLYE